MVVFGTYGAFWLTLGTTLVPFYNAEGYFTSGKTGSTLVAGEAEYYASYGKSSLRNITSAGQLGLIAGRLLSLLSFSPYLHLSDLLPANQSGVLHDLSGSRYSLVASYRRILETCRRRRLYGWQTTSRSWGIYIHLLYVWVVSSYLNFASILGVSNRIAGLRFEQVYCGEEKIKKGGKEG